MSASSKLFSLALVLVLSGPAMVTAQPDGGDPAQVSVASPTCIDHSGVPPGSGSITFADVGETPDGQRILMETVSAAQAPDCGLGPIQPCEQVADPDALVYVDTTFLCAKNSTAQAGLCDFNIFLEFVSTSQASKCDVPEVGVPDECSIISTIPVICEKPDDPPGECSIVSTIPVICEDPEDPPTYCDVAPGAPTCGGEIDPDPCSHVSLPTCGGEIDPDPCSYVSLPTCGGKIDPDPCSYVSLPTCGGEIDPDPCSHVNVPQCDGGVSTNPCDHVNLDACDEEINPCETAPSICPIYIPSPGPGPWDCIDGMVFIELEPTESQQAATPPHCEYDGIRDPCHYYPGAPTCDDKPQPCDHAIQPWYSDKPILCGLGAPADECSLLNIPDSGGDLPCGLVGPDPCAFAPDPPQDPVHEFVLPCGMGVPHPCSVVAESAEIPEGPLPCSDDPCADDPECRHFDPCQTLSPVLSTVAGFDCDEPLPRCNDVVGMVGQTCPREPCDVINDIPYVIEDCAIQNPCDGLDEGLYVPGGQWSPADCGTRICGEGMYDTAEEKEPTEVVGCLLPPICALDGVEACGSPNVGPPLLTDPCVAVDLVHAVVSGQIGVDLCGKASQVMECDSVVPPLPPETPCITYRLNGEERVMAPDMPAVFLQNEPELREETAEVGCGADLACGSSGYEYDPNNVVAVLWWIGAPVVTPNTSPHDCPNPPCVDINGVAGTFLVIPGPAAPIGGLTASAQIHTVEMGFEVSSFQPSVLIGDARFHGRLLGYGTTDAQLELQDPDTVDVELALVSPNVNGAKAAFARFNTDQYVRLALGATAANQGFVGRVHYDSSAPIKDPTKAQTVGEGTQVVVDWTTAVSGPLEITVNDYVVDVQNAPRNIVGADIGVINTPEEKFFGIHWPGEQGVAKVDVTTPHTSLLQFLDVPPSFDASFHLYDGPDPAYPDDPERDPWQFMVSRYSAAGDDPVPQTDVVVEFGEEVKVTATDVSPDLQLTFARVNPDPENTGQLAMLDERSSGLLVAPDDGTESNALPEFILGARDSTAATITNAATRVEVTVGDSAKIVVRDVVSAYVDSRAFVNLNKGFDGLDISFGDEGSIFTQLKKPSGDLWTLTLDASDADLLGNLYLGGRDQSDLRVIANARVANNLHPGLDLMLKVGLAEVLSFTGIQSINLDMDTARAGLTTLNAVSNQGSFLLDACPLLGCSGTQTIQADLIKEIIISYKEVGGVPEYRFQWALPLNDAAHFKIRSNTLDADVQPGYYTCVIEYFPKCSEPTGTSKPYDEANFNFKGKLASTICGDFYFLYDRSGESFDECFAADVTVGTIGQRSSGSTGVDAVDVARQEVSSLTSTTGTPGVPDGDAPGKTPGMPSQVERYVRSDLT